MKSDIFKKLLLFLQKLDKQVISYSLAHHRDDAVDLVRYAVANAPYALLF